MASSVFILSDRPRGRGVPVGDGAEGTADVPDVGLVEDGGLVARRPVGAGWCEVRLHGVSPLTLPDHVIDDPDVASRHPGARHVGYTEARGFACLGDPSGDPEPSAASAQP